MNLKISVNYSLIVHVQSRIHKKKNLSDKISFLYFSFIFKYKDPLIIYLYSIIILIFEKFLNLIYSKMKLQSIKKNFILEEKNNITRLFDYCRF